MLFNYFEMVDKYNITEKKVWEIIIFLKADTAPSLCTL